MTFWLTEDERLIALLPELFDAGGTISRNVHAADIREMHREIMAVAGKACMGCRVSLRWVDGTRPWHTRCPQIHLKPCDAEELGELLRRSVAAAAVWSQVYADWVLCLANAIWCVTRTEFADFRVVFDAVASVAYSRHVRCTGVHLVKIGFRGDATRHIRRTGGMIAWECFVSSGVVLAAAQCGSFRSGSGSGRISELTELRAFFCHTDGGPIAAEVSTAAEPKPHRCSCSHSARSCGIIVLLLCTDL